MGLVPMYRLRRSKRLQTLATQKQKPELATVRAFCCPCSNNRRKILFICTVFMPATTKPKLYNPRHPERTLLYQTVAEHYETWLDLASAGQFDGQGDHHTPKPYVRKAFAKYLECGIFAHGFARARCGDCGHDFLVAFSCKGRGVCLQGNKELACAAFNARVIPSVAYTDPEVAWVGLT